VTYHLDSTGAFIDTTYNEVVPLNELDEKHMQFRDLPITYKYINNDGYFADDNFITGTIWGRQITLKGDSLTYLHHESDANVTWSIKFEGTKI
jgi:hypothetical protein